MYLHCTDWNLVFFKLFKPLNSFSYAIWSSLTFLASYIEPWTCWNFITLIVSITLHPSRIEFFTCPSSIVPSLHRLKACIFKQFKPLASFSHVTWSSETFIANYSVSWRIRIIRRFVTDCTSLHRLKPSIFKIFKPIASFSYAIWSSATFLARWSEPWTCGNFNTLIVSITLQPVGLGLFTTSSAIVPSLHRVKPSIFKLFKPLASFTYAIWSSATFLASCSEPWTCGNFNTLIVPFMLQPVGLGLFTAPSPIVPSLHRLKPSIFKNFKPLASFSYAIWSSATFLARWSEPWTCGNFNTQIVSITLQPVGLGLFTASSAIVPSLHRVKPSIFKLFKPLASFTYAIWSSATFLASCSEPWTCGNFNTLIVSFMLQPVGLGLFTAPSPIVPSLHRLKPSIFKIFKPLASFSYATWSTATLRAALSLELAEISIHW